MKTLFGFGDSFTEGNVESYEPFLEWKNYRGGDLPESWLNLLGRKLKMNVKNYGIGGYSNDHIFHSFCEHSHEISKGDIVILNWTFIERFKWVYDKKWVTLNGGPIRNVGGNISYISNKTKDEIILNRMDELYIKDIYNYEKIITELCDSIGCDVYFWSADERIIYCESNEFKNKRKYIIGDKINNGESLFNEIYRNGGKTVPEECENKIWDGGHMGETGHLVQALLFFNYITNDNEEIDLPKIEKKKKVL